MGLLGQGFNFGGHGDGNGVNWDTFTGDPLNPGVGQQLNSSIWNLRVSDGYAEGDGIGYLYDAPSEDSNTFTIHTLRAYIPGSATSWDIRLYFSGMSSDTPGLSDRNYGAKLQLHSYPSGTYRALVGRMEDDAYNGYVGDTDITGQVRFNYSTETSGAIRLHRDGNTLYASRWKTDGWYWGNPPVSPLTLRTDMNTLGDLNIEMQFEKENNAAITCRNYDFEFTPTGVLIGGD